MFDLFFWFLEALVFGDGVVLCFFGGGGERDWNFLYGRRRFGLFSFRK